MCTRRPYASIRAILTNEFPCSRCSFWMVACMSTKLGAHCQQVAKLLYTYVSKCFRSCLAPGSPLSSKHFNRENGRWSWGKALKSSPMVDMMIENVNQGCRRVETLVNVAISSQRLIQSKLVKPPHFHWFFWSPVWNQLCENENKTLFSPSLVKSKKTENPLNVFIYFRDMKM